MNQHSIDFATRVGKFDSEDMVQLAVSLHNSGLPRRAVAAEMGISEGRLAGLITRNHHRFARYGDRQPSTLRLPTPGQIDLRRKATPLDEIPMPDNFTGIEALFTAPARAPGEPVPLVELTSRHCRWPVSGDRAETMFCGCGIEPGRIYCEGHRARAFTPARAGTTPT